MKWLGKLDHVYYLTRDTVKLAETKPFPDRAETQIQQSKHLSLSCTRCSLHLSAVNTEHWPEQRPASVWMEASGKQSLQRKRKQADEFEVRKETRITDLTSNWEQQCSLPQVPPVVRPCDFAEGHRGRAISTVWECLLNTVNSDSLECRLGEACIVSGINALAIIM